MSNPAAIASITGRLTKDIHWFEPNKDGSISGAMTLAVDNNYKSIDGAIKTNYLPVRIFIPAAAKGNKGSWNLVGEGDLIQALFTMSANTYQDRNGETVFPNAVTLTVDGWPNFLEPKSVTQARRAAKAAAVAAGDNPESVTAQVADKAAMIEELENQIAALGGSPEQPFVG